MNNETIIKLPKQVEAITEQLDSMESKTTSMIRPTPLVNMGKGFENTEGKYTAWPFSGAFYDDTTKKFYLIYNARSLHESNDGKVWIREKWKGASFGNATLVASRDGYNCTTHGSGRAKNGDFLSLVRVSTNGNVGVVETSVYRSKDKGKTWTYQDMRIDGQPFLAGECGDCYCTSTGRLLSYARMEANDKEYIIYSDDNGYTWNKIALTNNTQWKGTLEGKFLELGDGTIICVVRQTMYVAGYPSPLPAVFTRSFDGGLTWEQLSVSSTITDMTCNPCAMLYHEDIKAVEIFYTSRTAKEDGYGSIYQSIVSEDRAKNGDFGTPSRIGVGANARDFGYITAVKADNIVNVFYYNGTTESTNIYYLLGQQQNSNYLKHSIINPITGENHIEFNKVTNKLVLKDTIVNTTDVNPNLYKLPIMDYRELKTPTLIYDSSTSGIPTGTVYLDIVSKVDSDLSTKARAYLLEVNFSNSSVQTNYNAVELCEENTFNGNNPSAKFVWYGNFRSSNNVIARADSSGNVYMRIKVPANANLCIVRCLGVYLQ